VFENIDTVAVGQMQVSADKVELARVHQGLCLLQGERGLYVVGCLQNQL
jgi:hypothetical protein